ncbi:hypothetical protein [Streptomyces sp. NPDC056796]|uniref:hypothetical protein n=1 Tax=Streptomyces sp. NPDC056796 TaxID=3345947 RepID=UPI0036B2548B
MVKLQVIGCDICRQTPALTYEIAASDGRSVEVDLCSNHGESIEALLADFGSLAKKGDEEAAEEAAEETAPVVPKRTRTPAKKAATPRRRPKVTPLEDIEALKKKG